MKVQVTRNRIQVEENDTMIKKAALFIIIISLLVGGCNNSVTKPTPSASEGTSKVPTLNMEPLHMSYIPGGTLTFMIDKWEKLAEYLTDSTGIPIETNTVQSYSDFEKAFKNGDIDIGYLGGVMYVKLSEEMDIIPLVTPVEKGKTSYKGYIIVKKDSNINTIEDLKGKSFSFVNKSSTSGYLLPRLLMLEKGIKNTEEYFSKVEYTEDHISSLISVYNGYSDGGAISEFVFETDEAKKYDGIKVITETDDVPAICVVVRSDMNHEYVEKLKNAFMDIGNTPKGKEVGKLFGIQGYIESSDSSYDDIREGIKKISEYEDVEIFDSKEN